MEIIKIFSNVEDPSENLYSVLLSEDEVNLLQKEFNSKAQKVLRRISDYKIGAKRLAKAGDAEYAFFNGAARYPGETIDRVFREGPNWHFKTTMRPGVSLEKAKELTKLAEKQRTTNPKMFNFRTNLIAGRARQHGIEGYSENLHNLNHRINARDLGDTNIKEDLKRLKG